MLLLQAGRPSCCVSLLHKATLLAQRFKGVNLAQQQRRYLHLTNSSRPMEVLAAVDAAGELDGQRLDAALQLLFPGRWSSASALKKTVRRGEVLVNGAVSRTDATVKQGDRVEVVTLVGCLRSSWKPHHQAMLKQQLPGLDVAYEDQHMAVVIKPQGLLSQGPKGAASVAGRIKYCLNPTALPGALKAPVIAHRLDVGTGGLLMVAKTRAAVAKLSEDLKQHNIQKRYLALVTGRLGGSGVIDHAISGVPSVSLFRVEAHMPSATFGCLTLVSLWPKTGRTHQLRKHMAYIGHPVLGDLQYKHHRKPDCTALLTDIQSWLPQVTSTSLQQQSPQPQTQQELEQPASTHALPQEQQQQQSEQPPQQPQEQQHTAQACEQPAQYPALELPVYDGSSSFHSRARSSAQSSCAGSNDGSDDDGDGGSSSSGADGSGASVSKCRGQVLNDGTVVGTCLWAVELQLLHPHSGQRLDISVADAVERLCHRICGLDACPDTV